MAISQAKRSRHSAQSRALKPGSPKTFKRTSPEALKSAATPKPKKKRRRRRPLPLLPPAVVTRRGKTTIRRFINRSFHRMEEVKGKIVDYLEFFTSSESHSIDICFQDKTTLHFSIDPGSLLETEYADWKTGTGDASSAGPLCAPPAQGPRKQILTTEDTKEHKGRLAPNEREVRD